jgi:hypothetical protein
MKKVRVLLIALSLLAAGSSYQLVTAQEKSKAELDKEQKIQQEIILQKKAMLDQMKVLEESKEALKKDQSDMADSIFNIRVESRSPELNDNMLRYFNQRGNRSFNFDEPFIVSPGVEFYNHSLIGDSEKTTWDFSKSVKESTFSKEYSFDVEKTVNSVVMSVMGDCKSGDIRIKIVMPSGKSYSDIIIDESGNLNWRKSFTISETENQDKAGDWKFKIDSNKATGFFKISLQTY